ncbi:hypothetical protein KPH14_011821 [Odynerus spinipes]|uniref:Uncharacterized protein n=1 Tax=Odynerus spinipes TaxID=1348599 RepID=A0AAD9RVT3_9HYME|nr:hypothetical protein KPH14_011821 [Odynerus spinipes]
MRTSPGRKSQHKSSRSAVSTQQKSCGLTKSILGTDSMIISKRSSMLFIQFSPILLVMRETCVFWAVSTE